jgi:hypothetical protein
MKGKDDIKATGRKLLCCYGQAQRMTDERRPEIKKEVGIPWKKKYRDLQGNSARRSVVDSE